MAQCVAELRPTELADYPAAISDGLAHVEVVARALSTIGSEVRNMISEANELEDAGTADLFTEISPGINKMLWFVGAHSQAAMWLLYHRTRKRPVRYQCLISTRTNTQDGLCGSSIWSGL